MERLLNKNVSLTGVVVGECMMIEKHVYEHEEEIKRKKRRLKTFKNANLTISGGVKWINEDCVVFENRFRVPLVNIYYNNELIAENMPVYFGNYELRKNFKINDEIRFSGKIEKFTGYSTMKGYIKVRNFVDEKEFLRLFDKYDDDCNNPFADENGEFDMKYEITKTRLDRGANIWKNL